MRSEVDFDEEEVDAALDDAVEGADEDVGGEDEEEQVVQREVIGAIDEEGIDRVQEGFLLDEVAALPPAVGRRDLGRIGIVNAYLIVGCDGQRSENGNGEGEGDEADDDPEGLEYLEDRLERAGLPLQLDDLLVLEVEQPFFALQVVQVLLVVLGDLGVCPGVLLLDGAVLFSQLRQVVVQLVLLLLQTLRALDEVEGQRCQSVGAVDEPERRPEAEQDRNAEGQRRLAHVLDVEESLDPLHLLAPFELDVLIWPEEQSQQQQEEYDQDEHHLSNEGGRKYSRLGRSDDLAREFLLRQVQVEVVFVAQCPFFPVEVVERQQHEGDDQQRRVQV